MPGKRTAVEALSFGPGRSGTFGGAAIQRRLAAGGARGTPDMMNAAATHATSGPATSLPHLDRIQRLFGVHDVSGARAYVGGHAAEGAAAMGAEAFATGDQVAFGAAPDLHTAAHEAAHVVQQRAGVQLKGGVGEAGDPYEQHADAVADAVVQGKSAEALLSRFAGAGGGSAGSATGAAPVQARWLISRDPLPRGDARWENVGDGNAPTGLYRYTGMDNRWTRNGTQDQYLYDQRTRQLNRALDFAIDMSGGASAIDVDALIRTHGHPEPSQPVVAQPSIVLGGSSGGDSGGARKELPKRDDVERPPLSLVQALASTLFSDEALKDGSVRDLLLRVLGDGFVQWARSGIDDGKLEHNVDEVCLNKLAELQKRYADLTLIDVIVISAYSWYADSYVRIERVARVKDGFDDFGKWQAFADQLTRSLRKLKRFTGDTLYRCSQPGHEAEHLKGGGEWHATSFLSSTYSDEARADLETNSKYKHGSTLHMDARDAEGYHMEEFSRFEKEYEVVLLPGHKVTGKPASGSQGRRIDATLTPPSTARPRTGRESDSVAEFDQLHKSQASSVKPPPMMPRKLGESELGELRGRADELYNAAVAHYPLTEQTYETLRPAASALAAFLQQHARHLEEHRVAEYQEFLAEVARRYAPHDQAAERELRAQRERFAATFLAEESGGLVVAADTLAEAGLARQLENRANAYFWHLPTRELRAELFAWSETRYAHGTRLPVDQPDTPDLRLAHYLAERAPLRAKFIELRQRHLAERGGERGVVIRQLH